MKEINANTLSKPNIETKIIYLRPHHLICNVCFQGKGYNKIFVDNFIDIHTKLETNKYKIQIIKHTFQDDLCKLCPQKNISNELLCNTEDKVFEFDTKYLNVLDIKYDDVLSMHDVKNKIQQHLTLEKFRNICGKCSWFKHGICENIIKTLVNNNKV